MDANKVEHLLNKKQKIEQEIAHIQLKYNHLNKVIKMIHQGSSNEVRWECKDCSMVLGWPSEQERNKFFKNS